jgi:hypothetical protein
MNTGTPLDLTPFGSVLQGIGLLYWFLVALVLAVVITKAKSQRGKWLSAAVVLGIMVGPIAWDLWKKHEVQQKAKARLDTAMALFNEHCKSAGEKIYRTVDNVEGIVWMKWRPAGLNKDQFTLDDPYGKDCSGEGCIYRLLRPVEGMAEYPKAARQHADGYRYVETIDPRDGHRYRYTAVLKGVKENKEAFSRNVERTGFGAELDGSYLELQRQPIEEFSARYGVVWDDISTPEDRKYWIAGGSLKAIDLKANEVMAERFGFLIDPGQGSTAGFRDPWGWAQAYGPSCPSLVDEQEHRTRIGFTERFSHKVLRPLVEE